MPQTYALLHVGKTGGTYTKHVIAQVADAARATIFLPHQYSLAMALTAWPQRSVVFGLRSPERIFVSGFYSRMRQGFPRYYAPWSPEERVAFSTFTTPNLLAEGLSSACLETRRAAESAMSNIMHVRHGLRGYLESAAFVRSALSRIAFILRQEVLDNDLRQFLSRFVPGGVDVPPANEMVRHSNPAHLDTHLSVRAGGNIARWYQSDFEIYRECLDIASSLRTEERVS